MASQLESSGEAAPVHADAVRRLAIVISTACLCWAASVPLFWPTVRGLANFWLTDDLKSMGALVPLVCLALVLRAWRRLGWTTQGTWWGLALLAFWAILVFVRDQTLLVITINKDWLLQVPPLPLVAVMIALGLVLLLGGTALLRAAWFPVLLAWAVLPVPQTFSRRIDLPLQHIAAQVARSLAHRLGAPLDPDTLRIMFTPSFGMFIAPGCNGIRGSVTLGLAAIVVSYLYRFRWFVYAPVVAGAVLLGYVFNLLRLCFLVFYYKLALPYPWLQQRGETADYILGGCLFLVALAIFFAVVDRLRERPGDVRPEPAAAPPDRSPLLPFLLRAAAMLALSTLFAGEYLHLRASLPVTSIAIQRLPDQIGSYHLVNRYSDALLDGVVVYTWGEYAGPDPGSPHIKLGISPVLGLHDAQICHMTRGEDPMWRGRIDTPTPSGAALLSGVTYKTGTMQWLEASTVCDGGACSELQASSQGVAIVYARPHSALPLQSRQRRQVPVLLRIESGDTAASPAEIAARLSVDLAAFLRQADLAKLTEPYSYR